MADNVQITPGSGNVVAADEVTDGTLGQVKVQFTKIMDGTLDSTNKLIVTASGAVKTDGTATTQPVSLSGNVTVVQPTGTNLHVVVDTAPTTAVTGPLTDAQLRATPVPISGTVTSTPSGTQNVNVTNAAGASAVNIQDGGNSITVDGTVTANAGTNLNTSALALNATLTNGTQQTEIVDATDAIVGPVQTISGTNYLPVTLASSGTTGSAIPSRTVQIGGSDGVNLRTIKTSATGVVSVDGSAVTQPVSGTVTTTPPANASTNVTQFGGTNVSTGTGASGAGIPRVTIANDSSLAANQSVNVAQINGSTTVTAATGVQKVGIVGNTGAVVDAAGQNAASPANEILVAGQFNTTPTTITTGNISPLQLNAGGELRVADGDLELAQSSTIAGQLGPLVQGAVTTGFPTYTTAQTNPLSLTPNGALRVCACPNAVTIPVNQTTVTALGDGNQGLAAPTTMAAYQYGGAYSGTASAAKQGFSPSRMPTTFKTVSVAATTTGNSAVWTPAASNKFRLMGYQITAQGLSATASAAITVSFQDAAVALGFGTYSIDIPAVAGIQTGVTQISGGMVQMGNFGILSATAGQVLNFNISAAGAGTTGTYQINVFGTEE